MTKRKSDAAPRDATSYILKYVTPTFSGESTHDTPSDVREALSDLRAEGLCITSFTVSRSTDDDITGEFA